jgi:hypothetical protein
VGKPTRATRKEEVIHTNNKTTTHQTMTQRSKISPKKILSKWHGDCRRFSLIWSDLIWSDLWDPLINPTINRSIHSLESIEQAQQVIKQVEKINSFDLSFVHCIQASRNKRIHEGCRKSKHRTITNEIKDTFHSFCPAGKRK